ncbi:MAG: c-type cytochrome [Xanthomonadales bacterium]|nr:c-type cytochrome [Xanthomonadales bacterium]
MEEIVKYFIFILIASLVLEKVEAEVLLNSGQQLGKAIFFDTELSSPPGQSCATCHQPNIAFSNSNIVHSGADSNKFANRNTPSLSYVSNTPAFKYDTIEGNVVSVGGFFWDGRAKSFEDQVLQPFINPLEMGIPRLENLVAKIKKRPYFKSLLKQYRISPHSQADILNGIKKTLIDYMSGPEFNKFNSKYDHWLTGQAKFTLEERHGMLLFERVDKGNCAACHTLKRQHVHDKPLFTDFTYDNIGVPKNTNNPFYQVPETVNPLGINYIDYGLGNTNRIKDKRYLGMFKVPTLRNVEVTAPYMHNGVFSTLKEVVEFYNSRDKTDQWGAPEVPYNVNDTELGNLSLTEIEIEALVAFLKTLTDDYEEENK